MKKTKPWILKPSGATEGWSPEAIKALKRIETARFYMNKKRYFNEINKLKKIAPHLTEQIDLRFGTEKPKKSKSKVKQTVVVVNYLSKMMELTLEEQRFAKNTQELISQIKDKL
jgi:hypothetical protein